VFALLVGNLRAPSCLRLAAIVYYVSDVFVGGGRGPCKSPVRRRMGSFNIRSEGVRNRWTEGLGYCDFSADLPTFHRTPDTDACFNAALFHALCIIDMVYRAPRSRPRSNPAPFRD
jgi:hypothetical protein